MEGRSKCLRAGKLNSHDVRTHMKHYGKWTDDEGLMATVQAITKHNAGMNASLTKRQQQMQALHEGRIEVVWGEPKPEVTP